MAKQRDIRIGTWLAMGQEKLWDLCAVLLDLATLQLLWKPCEHWQSAPWGLQYWLKPLNGRQLCSIRSKAGSAGKSPALGRPVNQIAGYVRCSGARWDVQEAFLHIRLTVRSCITPENEKRCFNFTDPCSQKKPKFCFSTEVALCPQLFAIDSTTLETKWEQENTGPMHLPVEERIGKALLLCLL